MLSIHLDDKAGWKKLEGDNFHFHYPSSEGSNHIPEDKGGIQDDVARNVAEQFIEQRCAGSAAHIDTGVASFGTQGSIMVDTSKGTRSFRMRHFHGMKSSLEIYKYHA